LCLAALEGTLEDIPILPTILSHTPRYIPNFASPHQNEYVLNDEDMDRIMEEIQQLMEQYHLNEDQQR
jgi:hypothetical protein